MSRQGYDANLAFSTDQTVTVDADSTNTVDLGAAGALPEEAVLVIDFGACSGTTPTMDITVKESADNSNWTDVMALPQLDDTVASTEVRLALGPPELRQRYMKLNYNVGGTTPSFAIKSARIAV